MFLYWDSEYLYKVLRVIKSVGHVLRPLDTAVNSRSISAHHSSPTAASLTDIALFLIIHV